MANFRGDREESMGSQRKDQFMNLERRRDCDVTQYPSIRDESINSDHISRSHSRLGSHLSREQETCNLRSSTAVRQMFFNDKLFGGLVALNSLRNSGGFDQRVKEILSANCPSDERVFWASFGLSW
nr:hypothetical protein CFP56_50768 [Quercus suber]